MKQATNERITAWMLAAGLMLCISGPIRANDVQANDVDTRAIEQPAEADPGQPIALNKFSKRKRSTKVTRAQKPRVIARGYRRKTIDADATPNAVPMSETEQVSMSDNVANANAQWPAPDASVQAITTLPSVASPIAVATDRQNEFGRDVAAPANGNDAASQIATKMASQVAQNSSQAAGVNVPTTATPAMSAMASSDKPYVVSNDDSAWGQSSLIGKMFIAFGGLLTMASAARMFMA